MLAVLTGVLVAITAYYAWQTRAMVVEMRQTRVLGMLPRLVLDIEMVDPKLGEVVVANAGGGAALNGHLRLVFLDSAGERAEVREWLPPLLSPGERHNFLPPADASITIAAFSSAYPIVLLEGAVGDIFGKTHEVKVELLVRELWDRLGESSHRFQVPALERVARDLHRLVAEVEKIADATGGDNPPRFRRQG